MELATTFALGVLMLRFGLLLAGILFCWFGYRLFSLARAPGGAEISFKDVFKVNLYQIGPGVFFSLFGAAILIYSIHKPPSLELRDILQAGSAAPAAAVDTGPGSSQHSVVIAGARNPSASAVDPAALLRASSQVAFVNRIDASGSVAAQDRKDIERMSRQIRLSIMRGVWQADWGDPADFEAWVRDPGGRLPNAAALKFFDRR